MDEDDDEDDDVEVAYGSGGGGGGGALNDADAVVDVLSESSRTWPARNAGSGPATERLVLLLFALMLLLLACVAAGLADLGLRITAM